MGAIARARTAYYALVYRLDVLIGDVLQCLADEGLEDDTLIVYSTDHGDQLGERGLWWKHTLYEDSVRVPLVLCWPGRLPAGERRAHGLKAVGRAAPTERDVRNTPPGCKVKPHDSDDSA